MKLFQSSIINVLNLLFNVLRMLYTFREMYPLILYKKVEKMNLIAARGEMDTSLSEIRS